MAKKTANTGLALVVAGTSVPDALTLLQAELKSLTDITTTSYKTGGNGMVSGFPNSIQAETSIEKLIQMYSSINGRSAAYDNAQDELASVVGGNFQAPCFRDNGQSAENIKSDIALRIKQLSVFERKAKLEKLIEEAKAFMTKEDQFAIWQKRLASELGLTPGQAAEEAEQA